MSWMFMLGVGVIVIVLVVQAFKIANAKAVSVETARPAQPAQSGQDPDQAGTQQDAQVPIRLPSGQMMIPVKPPVGSVVQTFEESRYQKLATVLGLYAAVITVAYLAEVSNKPTVAPLVPATVVSSFTPPVAVPVKQVSSSDDTATTLAAVQALARIAEAKAAATSVVVASPASSVPVSTLSTCASLMANCSGPDCEATAARWRSEGRCL